MLYVRATRTGLLRTTYLYVPEVQGSLPPGAPTQRKYGARVTSLGRAVLTTYRGYHPR